MNSWLVAMAERKKTDEDELREALESLPASELQKLAYAADPLSRPTRIEEMAGKIETAVIQGQQLAHEHGPELEKQALAFLAPLAGKLVAGLGGRLAAGKAVKGLAGNAVKGMATDAVTGAAGKAISGLKPQAPAAAAAGEVAGGFKYAGFGAAGAMVNSTLGRSATSFMKASPANAARGLTPSAGGRSAASTMTGSTPGQSAQKLAGIMNSIGTAAKGATSKGGLLQRAAGYAVRNPGTALTAMGAVGGAVMAPRDPQTGQKQYLRGAMMGGGLAAGANAISGGSIANKMRASVMNRESPLLGQGARSYLMESAANTKHLYPKPGAAVGAAGAGSAAGAADGYRGGPTMGQVKIANRSTLTYDPATKTFTRQNVTPSMASSSQVPGGTLADIGVPNIQAGQKQPLMQPGREAVRAAPVRPSGIPSQAHALQGGNVMSSSPRPGVGAAPMRAAATPPPIPAAARMAGPGGLGGMAAKVKLPGIGGLLAKKR